MGPCKILWAPFNFAAGPCISSQALYLDQIQIDSGRRPYVPTGKLSLQYVPTERALFEPGNARLQK